MYLCMYLWHYAMLVNCLLFQCGTTTYLHTLLFNKDTYQLRRIGAANLDQCGVVVWWCGGVVVWWCPVRGCVFIQVQQVQY